MSLVESLPVPVRRALGWIDRNPFVTLYLPPLIFLAHFALVLKLAALRFPDHPEGDKVQASLLLIAMFLVAFPCLGAMALGMRQAFVLPAKIFPVLGILANGLYLSVFVLYFLFIMVLQNLT